MTDQELIAYLKLQGLDKDVAAADRIKELVKEQARLQVVCDQTLDERDEALAKLTKTVETLREIYSTSVDTTQLDLHVRGWIEVYTRTTLAELEGK
jgi:hypothetical protein